MTAPWWWACVECGELLKPVGETSWPEHGCTDYKIHAVSPAIAAALREIGKCHDVLGESPFSVPEGIAESLREFKQIATERSDALDAALRSVSEKNALILRMDGQMKDYREARRLSDEQLDAALRERERLLEYATHRASCEAFYRDTDCDCGFADLAAALALAAPKAERCPECSSVLVDGRCPYPQHAPAPKAECCPKCAGPNRYGDSCIEDCECHEPAPVPGGEDNEDWSFARRDFERREYERADREDSEQRGGRSAWATPAGGENLINTSRPLYEPTPPPPGGERSRRFALTLRTTAVDPISVFAIGSLELWDDKVTWPSEGSANFGFTQMSWYEITDQPAPPGGERCVRCGHFHNPVHPEYCFACDCFQPAPPEAKP